MQSQEQDFATHQSKRECLVLNTSFNSISIYSLTAWLKATMFLLPLLTSDMNAAGFELLAVIWKEWDVIPD